MKEFLSKLAEMTAEEWESVLLFALPAALVALLAVLWIVLFIRMRKRRND